MRTALALLGTVALLQGCVPGPSVATADLTSDREVDLRWDAARDREYEVWLAFDDVRYDGRLTIDGQLTVETAGAPTARYTTAFDSENNLRAVQERAVVSKRRWVNSRGSLTGYIFAFPIPPQAPGTPIRVAGRLEGPSPRAGRIRLLAVAED